MLMPMLSNILSFVTLQKHDKSQRTFMPPADMQSSIPTTLAAVIEMVCIILQLWLFLMPSLVLVWLPESHNNCRLNIASKLLHIAQYLCSPPKVILWTGIFSKFLNKCTKICLLGQKRMCSKQHTCTNQGEFQHSMEDHKSTPP